MPKFNQLKCFLILLVWFVSSSFIFGLRQAADLETLVTIDVDNTTVEKVLASIIKQTGLAFSYSPSVVDTKKPINCHLQQKSVRYVLNYLLGSNVNVKQRGKYILLVKNNETNSKDRIFIEGYVTEPSTGKRLSEATVYNKELKASAVTDKNGYFKLELKPIKPITELRVCKSGFADTIIHPTLQNTGFVDINLQSADTTDTTIVEKKWTPRFPDWLVPREILVNALNMSSDSIFDKFQISFLPYISTNQFLGGKSVVDYSVNILAGYTESVRRVELGGWFNFVRRDAGLCQLAGFGNVVGGRTFGVQGAGFYNISRENKGIQLAGFFNVGVYDGGICQYAGFGNFTLGKVNGIQAGGYFNIAKEVRGLQMGSIFNFAQILRGAQVTAMVNYGQTVTGAQVSGMVNIGGTISGTQLAGMVNFADTVSKSQISGMVNVAREVRGVQLTSMVNVVSYVKGAQIGLVNVADSCSGVSIGLLSFVKKGYNHFEISADELINCNLSYKFGVPWFYNILNVGISPGGSKLLTCGYGFGSLMGKNNKTKFNIELTQNSIDEIYNILGNSNIQRLYCGLNTRLFEHMSLNYGLCLNLFETSDSNNERVSQFAKNIPYSFLNSNSETKLWLGARLGVRF